MRRRSRVWKPKAVEKIKGIIFLFIHTHPVGLAVLQGKCEFPTPDELHDMIVFTQEKLEIGIVIQASTQVYEAQARIESHESEKHLFSVLKQYGGQERLVEVVNQYAKAYPEEFQVLEEIGNAGRPDCRSFEAVAGKYNMDVKTLKNRRDKIIEDIAMGMVFYGEDFQLF